MMQGGDGGGKKLAPFIPGGGAGHRTNRSQDHGVADWYVSTVSSRAKSLNRKKNSPLDSPA
jgi:hypothetical protein